MGHDASGYDGSSNFLPVFAYHGLDPFRTCVHHVDAFVQPHIIATLSQTLDVPKLC